MLLTAIADRFRENIVSNHWSFDVHAAPMGEALQVRISRLSQQRVDAWGSGPYVAIRQAAGWIVVTKAGRAVRVDEVSSWAPIATPRRNSASATPNLFVLGAGKCGTTSLHATLRQHPDIHASKIKEPTFFCSYFQVVKNPLDYFRQFDSTANYRVESSHAYLSNPETAPILRTLFPEAKFIVILRDPKERAYSLYRHMRRLKHEVDHKPYEESPDFLSALAAEKDRSESKAFFENCRQYFWNFMYCRSSLYDGQLERYFALFDRKQFHVVSLAEMSDDPVATTQGITKFLGIDAAPVKGFTFEVKNRDRNDYGRYCAESERMMDGAFEGVTDRVDTLVGRRLDWSM